MTITTNPPQAIETEYGGCCFRSRLEARWAVAFDALGEAWLYEPQGFEVAIPPDGERRRYLPDFYLSDRRLWVEVKGSSEQYSRDWSLLLGAAHPERGLPADPEGNPAPQDGTYPRLMVLGPVPQGIAEPWARTGFPLFSVHEGRRAFQRCDLVGNTTLPYIYFPAVHGITRPLDAYLLMDQLLHVHNSDDEATQREADRINHALTSARYARFEYGANPQPIPWRVGESRPEGV